MTNTLALIRHNDIGSLRHGGWQKSRVFVVYINGVEVRRFIDGVQSSGYYHDQYLDREIDTYLVMMEKALGCKTIRGRVRDFDPRMGNDPLFVPVDALRAQIQKERSK